MKNSVLIFFVLLCSSTLFAQGRIKVYLEKQEINPQSVHYFDPVKIDSISFRTMGSDSIFNITMKDKSDLLNYYQVLDLYNLDNDARKLAFTINGADPIQHPELMFFNKNRLQGITVTVPPDPKRPSHIEIAHLYNRADRLDAGVGKMLHWVQGVALGLGENDHYKWFKP